MSTINKKALERLTSKAVFTASDARAEGIQPSNLSYYIKINLIERVARGVYRGVDAQIDTDFQWEDLVLTAQSIPNGVVCLISALALYELTDEIPRSHWIAIPHATTAPKRKITKFVRMRDMQTGKTTQLIGNETVSIFNQERTIIDAFRYLSKEIAIKALKAALRPKRKEKLNLKILQEYAKKFRINIDPYLMTVTT